MSNTNITNLEITDNFQVWFDKTNEIIDLANESILLAAPGAGITVQGNSTLDGSFTANEILSDNVETPSLSVTSITRLDNTNDNIEFNSPLSISSSVENIFNLETTSGNRPILRMINGSNSRWLLGQETSSSSSSFSIRTEGSSASQITINQNGRVIANEFQGNGSLLTDINANNISSGTLDDNRIPNLNTSKITSGTFPVARIPDLNTSKITSGTFPVGRIPDLNTSKITSGTFPVARIPDLNANKITSGVISDQRLPSNIVREDRRLLEGNGINISGNGNLSSDRTISADFATRAEAEAGTNTVKVMSPARTRQAIVERVIDEDDFSSNSATRSPSQRSTRVYVENEAKLQGTDERITNGSGSYTIGDIPSDATEIEILFSDVSLNGNNDMLIQLGTNSSIETSGYTSDAIAMTGNGQTTSNSTEGMLIRLSSASRGVTGIMRLIKGKNNEWFQSYSASLGFVSGQVGSGGGFKSLNSTLTRIRLTRTGSNTFDGGFFAIKYR